MCPICGTALNLSGAPQADRERAFIRRQIAAGKTKEKDQGRARRRVRHRGARRAAEVGLRAHRLAGPRRGDPAGRRGDRGRPVALAPRGAATAARRGRRRSAAGARRGRAPRRRPGPLRPLNLFFFFKIRKTRRRTHSSFYAVAVMDDVIYGEPRSADAQSVCCRRIDRGPSRSRPGSMALVGSSDERAVRGPLAGRRLGRWRL